MFFTPSVPMPGERTSSVDSNGSGWQVVINPKRRRRLAKKLRMDEKFSEDTNVQHSAFPLKRNRGRSPHCDLHLLDGNRFKVLCSLTDDDDEISTRSEVDEDLPKSGDQAVTKALDEIGTPQFAGSPAPVLKAPTYKERFMKTRQKFVMMQGSVAYNLHPQPSSKDLITIRTSGKVSSMIQSKWHVQDFSLIVHFFTTQSTQYSCNILIPVLMCYSWNS